MWMWLYVGLLGEAPVSDPSLYSQLNVQCAILSVYLAALAQQVTGIVFYTFKLFIMLLLNISWAVYIVLINCCFIIVCSVDELRSLQSCISGHSIITVSEWAFVLFLIYVIVLKSYRWFQAFQLQCWCSCYRYVDVNNSLMVANNNNNNMIFIKHTGTVL